MAEKNTKKTKTAQTTAQKTAPKKATSKKKTTKAPAKKTVAKKVTTKKTTKKTTPKKVVTKKPAPKKVATTKTTKKKPVIKKTTKTSAKKETIKKSVTKQKLNPWFSMWNQPRATMRQILNSKPDNIMIWTLAALAGISETLDQASLENLGEKFDWPGIIAISIIVGALSGVIGLYVLGWLIYFVGKHVGGKATYAQIRSAMAWSSIPLIWALLFWVPEIALFGNELFTEEMPIIENNSDLLRLFFAFMLAELVVAVWAMVVYFKCLGEAQKFSAWKAVWNVLLTVLLLLLVFLGLALLVWGGVTLLQG